MAADAGLAPANHGSSRWVERAAARTPRWSSARPTASRSSTRGWWRSCACPAPEPDVVVVVVVVVVGRLPRSGTRLLAHAAEEQLVTLRARGFRADDADVDVEVAEAGAGLLEGGALEDLAGEGRAVAAGADGQVDGGGEQLEGAVLVGGPVAHGGGRHVRHDEIERADGGDVVAEIGARPAQKARVGREGDVQLVEVDGEDEAARADGLGEVDGPGARGGAQVEDPLSGAGEPQAAVELLQLVHGARGESLLLGAAREMILATTSQGRNRSGLRARGGAAATSSWRPSPSGAAPAPRRGGGTGGRRRRRCGVRGRSRG